MIHDTKRARRLAPLPAATLAALLLAGCASGHIGESWQCPLAEGGLCDSVAGADPAVPDTDAAGGTVLGEPLWRVRAAETDTPPARGPGQAVRTPCAADCDGAFDPFAWLARLFQVDAESGSGASGGDAPRSSDTELPPIETARAAELAPAGSDGAGRRPVEPAPAALPVEPETVGQDPAGGDLRTGEVVARIWIAPFVDADGVYREASHVRVVLEPAGWRLK